MIIDKSENICFYAPLLNNLENALKAVQALEDFGPGRYSFDGGGYFMVQKGRTKPMEEGDYEAHKKYVDVQLIVEGSEEIAWADICGLKELSYDEEKDKIALAGAVEHTMKISAGMCWIAFPRDGHKAIRHTKDSQDYTKVVIKLPVMQ